MRIRLFIFCAVLYLVILGAFFFYVNSAEYTLNVWGFSYTLPVAIWLLLPALFALIFALLHMSFYAFLNYLKYKNFYSDAKLLERFASDLLLEKEPRLGFKTSEFNKAAKLMVGLKNEEKIPNFNTFNEVIDTLSNLKAGKALNLKKFHLLLDNKINLLNEKNELLSDENKAFLRIKSKPQMNDSLDEISLNEVLEKGSLEQIKSLKIKLEKNQIQSLLKRFENKSLKMDITDFENFLKEANFNESEFVSAAKISAKEFSPDALIALFKKLKNNNGEAFKAYLYILAEFSNYDELELELKNKPNLEDFKLVLLARNNHLKIDLNRLIV